MTAPAPRPTTRPASEASSGSNLSSLANATFKQQPMTPQELRLECAKLAVALKPPATSVVSVARDIYSFVSGG